MKNNRHSRKVLVLRLRDYQEKKSMTSCAIFGLVDNGGPTVGCCNSHRQIAICTLSVPIGIRHAEVSLERWYAPGLVYPAAIPQFVC